jgi:hypothetical protein
MMLIALAFVSSSTSSASTSSASTSSASTSSASTWVETKFYPITREAYWINGDSKLSRRQHFEHLMKRIGYNHTHTSFEEVQALVPLKDNGLPTPTAITLSRAHQSIVQHISAIPPPR